MTNLHINDLSINKELDGKAMSAVHGGQDNQAIGTSQSNVQGMLAAGERRQRLQVLRPDEHPVGQHLQPGRHQHELRDERHDFAVFAGLVAR